MRKITKEEFIERSNKTHNNKYDYSKIEYIHTKYKVDIICPFHGIFKQSPHNHLNNHGCPICANNIHLTNEMFIEKSKKIHGDKYCYSITDYAKSNREKVDIICLKHGIFKQRPNDHLNGCGCPKCGEEEYLDRRKKRFINKSNKIHNNKYDYSKVQYVDDSTKVIIICMVHGEFSQCPCAHVKGHGCSVCGNAIKSNKEDFIKKSNSVHNNIYDYSKVEYINNKTKVIIICKKHGEFLQTPHDHLSGRSCIKCTGRISKESQLWLDSMNIPTEIREKYILLKNGRHIIADAFDEQRGIVYEYDHPYWHGHPDMNLNNIHPTIKKSYKYLYNRTIKRRESILDSGYIIIQTYGDDLNIFFK